MTFSFLMLNLFLIFLPLVKGCPTVGKNGDYSYDPSSDHGPDKWGSIKGFETCGKGKSQSPINIVTVGSSPLAGRLQIEYKLSLMELHEKVENWELGCTDSDDCGGIIYDGQVYKVSNVHFHSPSEHTIDGRRYPLEAHIVHLNGDTIKVAAFLFEIGLVPNAIPALAINSVCLRTEKMMVALNFLVDPTEGICTYSGSLTTPPCTEGVQFFVQRKILQVTEAELDYFIETFSSPVDANDRPLQPLNGRTVMCSA